MAETETLQLKSYVIRGDTNEVIKVGDKVLMKSSENDNAQYVAIVRSLKAHVDGNVMAEVRLYYRPEDTVGGRRPFHGSRELFLTNHFDTQSADTILHKCFVHHLLHYIKLKEVVGPHDYFTRFEYNTDTLWFCPDSVEVFCKCELPFNPDDFMLKCEACRDWYHPACINMTTDQAKQLDNFTCDDCRSLDGKGPHNKSFSSADPYMVETQVDKDAISEGVPT